MDQVSDEEYSAVGAQNQNVSISELSQNLSQPLSLSDSKSSEFFNEDDARKRAEFAWRQEFVNSNKNTSKLSCRKDFKDWINFLLELDYYSKTIHQRVEVGTSKSKKLSLKSKQKADEHRKLGTSIFVRKDSTEEDKFKRLEKTLSSYNKALTLAPWNKITNENPEIAIIYANRSAVFYELERYNEALRDIELGLKYGYPEYLKWKILVRKANILLYTGRSKSEIFSFIQESKKLIDFEMHKKFDDVEEKLKENHLKQKKSGFNEEIEWMNHRKYFTTPYTENPKFVNASSKLKIAYSEETGRHVIASLNINQGETLFDEEPYASVLLQDYKYTHCHHCQVNMLDYVIPCKSCSAIRYCSEECEITSWEQYHQYECTYEHFLQSFGLCHLATRIVLVAGVDEVLKIVNQNFAKDYQHQVAESIDVFCKDAPDYNRVYFLDEHSSESDEMKFPFLEAAVTCTLFLKLKTGFFNYICENDVYEVGGTVLLHLFQLVVNAQRIYTLPSCFEKGLLDTGDRISVGSGVFASTSMMNHSCDPQISTSYKFSSGKGRRFIVKAINTIAAGAEVCNSYGVTFRRDNVITRRHDLYSQYLFWCNCKKCTYEMESKHYFVDDFSQFRCQNSVKDCNGVLRVPIQVEASRGEYVFSSKELQCTNENCNYKAEPNTILGVFDKVEDLRKTYERDINRGELEKAAKTLEIILQFCRNRFHKYHYLLAEMEDEVAKFLIQNSNPKEAIEHLKGSLDYVKLRYGPWSNEYGIELRKYAETLELLQLEPEIAQKLIKKSRQILEIHSPSTH